MDQTLRQSLLAMLERDTRTRRELAADGSLFHGYNDRMREVHNSNARALAEIVDQHGWPDIAKVGEDGAAAAFLIAQHAIGLPRFMRACLHLITDAAEAGRIPRWQMALITDRVAMLEGKPQLYGTQFDWDPSGELNPLPIQDPINVDARRAACDLIPMAQAIPQQRKETAERGETAPSNWAGRQGDFEAWAKAIGWRE